MMDEFYFDDMINVNTHLAELVEYCEHHKIRLRLPWGKIDNRVKADNTGYLKYSEEVRGGDIFGSKDCLDDTYIWTNDMRVNTIKAFDDTEIAACEYWTRPFLKPTMDVEACGSCSTYIFGNLKTQSFTEIYNNELNRKIRAFMYSKPSLPREQWPVACKKCLCQDTVYSEENNGPGNCGKRWRMGDDLYV
jgi:MoaA/NifB/PqqE/SkfB family radical SAM enzyme